jgi:hypothetical protein
MKSLHPTVQARGARRFHHGHLDWSHGAELHGGPPEQQAAPGAGVGRPLRIRGRAGLHISSIQGQRMRGECAN